MCFYWTKIVQAYRGKKWHYLVRIFIFISTFSYQKKKKKLLAMVMANKIISTLLIRTNCICMSNGCHLAICMTLAWLTCILGTMWVRQYRGQERAVCLSLRGPSPAIMETFLLPWSFLFYFCFLSLPTHGSGFFDDLQCSSASGYPYLSAVVWELGLNLDLSLEIYACLQITAKS